MSHASLSREDDPAASDAAHVRCALSSLAGLGDATKAAVGAVAKGIDIRAGETIFEQGDIARVLYVIESGTVVVFRPAMAAENEHRVAEMGPGQILGELALIDTAPRSLSARAETDCRLATLDPDDLERLPDGDRHLAELKASLGIAIVRRMRETTDKHVEALERDLARAREQQQFGRFVLYLLVMMAIGSLANDIIARQLVDIDIYTESFLWGYITILLIPSFVIIHYMGIPLRELGVTTVGLRRSLTEGAILSVIFFVLTIGVAATLRALEIAPGQPVPLSTWADWLGIIPYVAHSFLQELVGRGLLLSAFRRFLNDERGILSNVVAAFGFSLFHLQFGLSAVAFTFVVSLVFGALYLRHLNLAGVTLLHAVAGVTAFTSGLM